MTFAQLKKHFRTVKAIAFDLGYTTQAVYIWKREGIPMRCQRYIEKWTDGELKADKK